MNRRKFLKALFSIPLLAVVPKIAAEEKKVIGQQADITVLDDYRKYVFPELPPLIDFWPIPEFFHPNEGLCEFVDIQTSVIMPKNRMLLACKSDVKGHSTWISNDDGLTWEALDGTELPKPTA